ncbi:polymorphic toxin-type HINT domain-containing protein [Pirellulaceae bacterium SH449]
MIRPAEYWEQQGAVPGGLTYVEFTELEASGLAKVTSIEPCPPIASGTGQVVTARIVTRQVAELVEIEFVGGETLTGTPQHPIWSIERQDWVELGDLEVGEHLWTEAGPIEISSTRLLGTGESVYNLEVHGHHIYQVSELGVLVHNAGIHSYNLGVSLAGGNVAKRNRITSRGYQAAHIVPNPGWKIARGKRTQELLDDLAKAREKLRKAGIDLDGKQNGFWAKPGHKGTHSADNLRKIADRINNSTDVAAALKSLKKYIISGRL